MDFGNYDNLRSNLRGRRFGFLNVLRYAAGRESENDRRQRHYRWWVRCDCGNELAVRAKSLVSGNTTSCGCRRSAQSRLNEDCMVRDANGRFSYIAPEAVEMISAWTWATASAVERGCWVREHMRSMRYSVPGLCELFGLTEDGARKILNGDDWRPEYE